MFLPFTSPCLLTEFTKSLSNSTFFPKIVFITESLGDFSDLKTTALISERKQTND